MLAHLVALALSPTLADFLARHTVEMRFRVVDEAGAPLAGADIHVSCWSKLGMPNRDFVTGPDGSVAVRRPKALDILRVWASKPGHAGVFRGWEQGSRAEMPAEFALPLPKGTAIGGRAVDEMGKPVAGVRIEVECETPASALPDEVKFNYYLAGGSGAAVTGPDGRWTLSNAPAAATAFRLRHRHAGFVSDSQFTDLARDQGVTAAQLRAGTATVKLAAGAKLSGAVTGADGKPLAGALVVFHDDPYLNPGTEVATDAAGRYELPALKPGRQAVTVIARHHRPERRELDLVAGARTEDFKLEPGRVLRVQVVDEAGRPVRAEFRVLGWRGAKSLYNDRHSNVLPTSVPGWSGQDGVYLWDGAPPDAVKFIVWAKGHRAKELELTADGKTQTLTMTRTPAVAGGITDARTGRPIAGVRVTPVIDFGRELYAVERNRGFVASGSYRAEFERSDCDYRLLVEAPGYRTAISRPNLLKDRVTAEDFKLEPAAPVAGRVLDAAGKPVAGAKVSLATSIQDLRYPDGLGHNLSATTDAAGAFRLPAQAERYALFVEHPTGTATTERGRDEPAGDLTLAPWASVSGVVYQAGKPVGGQRVLVAPLVRPEPGSGPRVQFDFQMVADDKGAFRFERVPAVPSSAWVYLGPWEDSPLTSSERVPLDPKPGQAVNLDLGKVGATVRGEFRLSGELPPGLTCEYSLNTLVRRTPDIAPPLGAMPLDLSKPFDHRRTDEPAARLALGAHRSFTVKPTRAGAFEIGGVPAGDYWLVARVFEKPEGCLVNPVGLAAIAVSVTPTQAAGGESVALGAVPVPVRRGPQVGDTLPSLTLADPAGKPLDLAQYRGKPLLLHCWAGWCGACPRDYAALRQLRADGTVLVGLNFDADGQTATELATTHGFDWPQALAGEAGEKLGASSIPLYLVIDAAGAVRYRGQDIAAARKLIEESAGK